ncbi:MAG: tRNA pseudouridine(55) synthase TruB, partial [Pirellulales bacterium]
QPPLVFGLLNIHKPTGVTSRDVVNVVARLVRPAKCGHAGTLDPLAEGVLVVCIGPATRLIENVQQMPKHYRGEFLLGRESPTEDVEGAVTELVDPPIPTRSDLDAAARSLVGTIEQRPPQFSALKVGGRRAYDVARRGETIDLAPRPVTVHELAVIEYDYPSVVLDVRCGGGTYIRSLGRDLAAAVGTAAVMSALVRTAIGPFPVESAIALADLNADMLPKALLPPTSALGDMPRHVLSAAELAEVIAGRFIEIARDASNAAATTGIAAEVAAVDVAGQLRAILVPRGDGRWGPNRVFQT